MDATIQPLTEKEFKTLRAQLCLRLNRKTISDELALSINEVITRDYRGLDGVQFAWGFLRRKLDYQKRYAAFQNAPEPIKKVIQQDGESKVELPDDTDTIWLALSPAGEANQSLGAWRAQNKQRKCETSEELREDLVPDIDFGIKFWIDPSTLENQLSETQKNCFLPPAFRFISRIEFTTAKLGRAAGSIVVKQRHPVVKPKFEDDGDVVVFFDVRGDLEAQVRTATRELRIYQARLDEFEHGSDTVTKKASNLNRLGLCLQLLDLQEQCNLSLDDVSRLLPSRRPDQLMSLDEVSLLRDTAIELVNHGYRSLPFRKRPEKRPHVKPQ